MFGSVIDGNQSLSSFQKFQYLRASVTGDAANVIKSLELSEKNYQVAWNVLKQRYDNKRAIVQTHLRALFELPNIARENVVELRRVADSATRHIQALNALHCPTEYWDDVLIYLISSKFDPTTAREWQASLTGTELPTFGRFAGFLEHRCHLLESIGGGVVVNQFGGKRLAAHVATAGRSCGYCCGDHLIYYCREFGKLPVPQRLEEVRKRKLCTNCLRENNHLPKRCKSGGCRICGSKHNSLLHFTSKSNEPSEKTKTRDEIPQNPVEQTAVMTHSSASYDKHVLVSTAIVYILDADGARQVCRVLLDSGSQANFITRACAKRLDLKSNPSNVRITGINGMASVANETVEIRLYSRLNNFSSVVDCLLTDRITEHLPTSTIEREKIHIPQNIRLADPDFHRPSDIDVLIGVELFWQLVCVGRLRYSRTQPTLQKTHLGWIIAGRLEENVKQIGGREVGAFHASVTDAELQDQLSKFWHVEESFQPVDSYSDAERYCERHFRDTTTRNKEGRVIVVLPIRNDKLRELGETRDIAMRRFYSLERRLNRDQHLKLQYTNFVHEYLSLGHMKLVADPEDSHGNVPTCYLPHHCIVKESSKTTKLRVVFDASCKSSSGVSLNDVLVIGPVVQQDLFSIILRFRTVRYGFSADITKMYRQILVNSSQTRLQRILWRDSIGEDVQTYELQTVTYGTAAAPYLATRTLKFLSETYAKEFPTGSKHIAHDFYVDDILSGADTIEDALKIKTEVVEILNRGAFKLNKWAANDKRLLSNDKGDYDIEIPVDKESTSRILGLLWNSFADNLRFAIELPGYSHRIMKRIILSEVARLFDPLGLIGPVIVVPKILLQEIWQLKLHWDESIPVDLHTRWSMFKDRLDVLGGLSIPRFITGHINSSRYQLHGFCDASQRAYGACFYIRRQISGNEFRSDLLCSKSRVAPLKAISIPRLKLCAALLLAQLWDRVRSSIDWSGEQLFLWSDSTIALQWISSCSRKWSVFIANRVGEIQRLTSVSDWRHVSSSENPADLLSRGINPHEIGSSVLWWHGPSFLMNDEESWPRSGTRVPDSEMPEMRRIVNVNVRAMTTNPFVEVIDRISNLNKICRIVAYCRRFLASCRRHGGADVCVTREETSTALNALCKIVQEISFSSEVRQLREKFPLTSSSPLVSLSPFLDDQGLIRVGGRLKYSEVDYGVRHPILLPKDHRLTHLIIESEHIRNHHAGLQGTIAAVRQRFWPLAVRSVARKIIRRCITCFRCRPVISEAKMGMLPSPRVTPSRPFSACGVDYAGPFLIRESKRRNARNNKAYVCVFVCLATKALHIELVASLTSEAFLAALKRFISRQGTPASIHSDNGTNFKGAARLLSEFYEFFRADKNQEKIKQFCRNSEISWQFIPPGAPHFGGLWEAAVKSIKHHLQRVVGDAHLTFEELQTVLCEIEAVLNSRPLTPLSSDPNDLTCITQGHFLIGDVMNGFPCRDLTDMNQCRLMRWQRVEQLRQHFWTRWSREYLNQLQQRHKWTVKKGEQLKPGQMVVVNQPGLPPLQWILGRVREVHSGADGIARSATVTTAKGVLTRPLSKLAILPLND